MIKTVTEAKLFGVTPRAITNWKKEKKPILLFLEKYFKEKDILEFLNSNKINKMELISLISEEELKSIISQRVLSVESLRAKLVQMPQSAKIIMIEQLEYCIDKNIDFTLDIAETIFAKNTMSVAAFDKEVLNLFKKKYLYYLDKIIVPKEIDYINQHKQEIIELLQIYRTMD